jgi:hypothetical protein
VENVVAASAPVYSTFFHFLPPSPKHAQMAAVFPTRAIQESARLCNEFFVFTFNSFVKKNDYRNKTRVISKQAMECKRTKKIYIYKDVS